jgi:outer membrane protein TolC
MDGSLFTTYGWGHQTRPQSNTITTGTTALAVDSYTGAMGVQKNFITGTGLTMTWNNQHITSNNPRSDINPTNSSNVQLQLTQHLTQGFSLAVNNRNIRIARNNLKASDLTFRLQVMTTVASTIGLYYDLVSLNENYRVRQKALEVAEKFLSDNRKQVEIGTLAPIEIVRAEANVATAQQDLTNSETALLQQEAILKSALSKNGIASPSLKSARVVPVDRLPEPADVASANLEELVDTALRDRPEILQTRINIANSKIGMEGSKNALLPALDFQASFQNNGMAGSRNFLLGPGVIGNADPYFLGGWGSSVAQVLRRNFPDYSIGFQLNVPLRNRTAQADYQRDMLSLRQSEIAQQKQINDLRVSVQNALTALTQARAAYAAAQKARVLQEQTLDAENKKYVLGASTAFLVVQTQRDLATAQYNEVAARNTFNRAKVNVDLVTAQLLDKYGVQIEDAKKGVSSRPVAAAPADN